MEPARGMMPTGLIENIPRDFDIFNFNRIHRPPARSGCCFTTHVDDWYF
jgi:hypothetical protein